MERYLPRVLGWVGGGGTRSGGFSDDPAEGEVALEEVKATDERVTWSNLSLNSHCWGSLPSPKAGESKKSRSSPSLRAPLCHPPRVTFGTSACLPISCHPLSALEPGGLHGEVMQKALPPAGACGLTVAWVFPVHCQQPVRQSGRPGAAAIGSLSPRSPCPEVTPVLKVGCSWRGAGAGSGQKQLLFKVGQPGIWVGQSWGPGRAGAQTAAGNHTA